MTGLVLGGQVTDALEFELYLHRTQLEVQGDLSHLSLGRPLHIFGEEAAIPRCAAEFRKQFGLGIRDWLKIALLVYSRAAIGNPERPATPLLMAEDFRDVVAMGVSEASVRAFFNDMSQSCTQIGFAYREVRDGARPLSPRAWGQRRPALARRPLVRTTMGYCLPMPALLLRSLTEMMTERFKGLGEDVYAAEVGPRVETYVGDMLRAHLDPDTVHGEMEIQIEGTTCCDFVVELPNCLLLVECKAVGFSNELVTRNSLVGSNAISRITKAAHQVAETASSLRNDGLRRTFPAGKPCIGLIVTLGQVPCADHAFVADLVAKAVRRDGGSYSALLHPPQPMHIEAFEVLVLMLCRDRSLLPGLVAGKLASYRPTVGDWTSYLLGPATPMKPFDLAFWRRPYERLAAEMGTDVTVPRPGKCPPGWAIGDKFRKA